MDIDNAQETEIDRLTTHGEELKRGLSRLSFVGMGLSDELDKELASLRVVIKKDGELKEIKASIDNISKILRTLDDDNELKNKANESLDVVSILLKKQLPSDFRKQLKKVKKQSKSSDANSILLAIVEIISQQVNSLDPEGSTTENPPKEKSKSSFFSSLFSSKNTGEKEIETSVEKKSDSQQNEQVALIKHQLPQDIIDSLQQLIDQLSSMDGYADVAELLNKEINKISQVEQLASILEMITNAFIEISDQEHVQLEMFLKTLNKRIVRVNKFIDQTLSYSQESGKDSNQLSLDLNSNMLGMRDSLSQSNSLDGAKSAVFGHMDIITKQIDRYCEKQKNSSEALVSKMDKLQEQLRATEDEASRLKDDLAEQRVRAQTDPLTRLPNRYSYNERLTQEYNRWRRYRNSLTLVIGDIDLFKKVNDDYGHAFGDKVLKDIANFLSESIRESDFIARFGGEEFVILLPETSMLDATRAMNKIRSALAKLEIKNGELVIPISMSFGISGFEGDDTTKAVFERADKALYRAKEKGRNLVCCQRAKAD